MSYSDFDLHLAVRESQRAERQEARQRMMRAMVTGKAVDMADVAQARGLVLKERENSIFSDAWPLAGLIFLIAGLFLEYNLALLAVGIVFFVIMGVSVAWKNLSLMGVTYERRFNRTRVFPGEPIEMTVVVQNDKFLPLSWLQFRDHLPVSPQLQDKISQAAAEISGEYILHNVFSMSGREKTERRTVLRFPTRGYYYLGPVSYESGDIFTLFTREREYNHIDTLIVYPQIWPLEALNIPPKEPFGNVKVRHSLFTDPTKTRGIRDYRPQDRFRDIHWKATARRSALQTKVYDPSTGLTVAVFLNVATYEKHWMGFDPELLERAISVAASIANFAVEQGWGVGVYANGSVPNSDQPIRVPPGRSPNQLSHILEALAAVTAFATGSIERMMFRESSDLPWVSTIVLVTATVTEEILVGLLRLKEAGRRIVLISLAAEPPPKGVGRILTYHIPTSAPAFRTSRQGPTVTEATLSTIPTPEPVELELEQVEK